MIRPAGVAVLLDPVLRAVEHRSEVVEAAVPTVVERPATRLEVPVGRAVVGAEATAFVDDNLGPPVANLLEGAGQLLATRDAVLVASRKGVRVGHVGRRRCEKRRDKTRRRR